MYTDVATSFIPCDSLWTEKKAGSSYECLHTISALGVLLLLWFNPAGS